MSTHLKSLHETTPGHVASRALQSVAGGPSFFDQLPDSAFVRASQLTNSYRRPPAPVPLPFSEQTLWRKVKAGEFPAPCKFGSQTTAWRVGDVRAWLNGRVAASLGAAA